MPPSDVLGVERRRRWQDEEKLAILEPVGLGGQTAADVARETDVTRQHIDQSRQEMRRKGFWPCPNGALFVPVEREAREMPCDISASGSEPKVEILSYSPILGQISGCFKLLPAPADRFRLR